MKKTLLSLTLIFTIAMADAQTDVSHMSWPPTAVLPEAHDWSIGFDVVPLIKTAGNLFHSSTGNDSIYSQEQFTLVGLYVKNETTAYRTYLRIGLSSYKFNNLVTDDANPSAQLTDTWTQNDMKIAIGAGLQKTRGKGRLRAIYGFEGGFLFGSHSNSFTYGNPFTSTNQTPTTTDFSTRLTSGGFDVTDPTKPRILDSKDGFMFGVQLDAFIGVEYFFAPKMSLSAEYGWGVGYASQGEANATFESWTGGSGGNELTTPVSIGSSSGFILDVINSTAITFHLYF